MNRYTDLEHKQKNDFHDEIIAILSEHIEDADYDDNSIWWLGMTDVCYALCPNGNKQIIASFLLECFRETNH